MAQGAPTEIVDSSGNSLKLRPPANLREIRTPQGRAITLRHDAEARIVRAEADHEWVEYGYNADGMLSDARYSDGRARHYSYADDLLTSVRDEAGRVLIRNFYLGSWLVRQQYSNGASCEIRYRMGAVTGAMRKKRPLRSPAAKRGPSGRPTPSRSSSRT